MTTSRKQVKQLCDPPEQSVLGAEGRTGGGRALSRPHCTRAIFSPAKKPWGKQPRRELMRRNGDGHKGTAAQGSPEQQSVEAPRSAQRYTCIGQPQNCSAAATCCVWCPTTRQRAPSVWRGDWAAWVAPWRRGARGAHPRRRSTRDCPRRPPWTRSPTPEDTRTDTWKRGEARFIGGK